MPADPAGRDATAPIYRPSDRQIASLRDMVASDEGARLVLAVFQYRPQHEINALMREFVAVKSDA